MTIFVVHKILSEYKDIKCLIIQIIITIVENTAFLKFGVVSTIVVGYS